MCRVLPILFNTDMVRAILDGEKTGTRRVIKPQPRKDMIYKLGYCIAGSRQDIGKFGFGSHECGGHVLYVKPPYQPGDILYVRETWSLQNPLGDFARNDRTAELRYKAGEIVRRIPINDKLEKFIGRGWIPSIHLPKSVARIWLKVTDVQVERLQDINDRESQKEGFPLEKGIVYVGEGCPTNDFAELWNSTVKKSDLTLYGWDANPWVWVIDFERCEKPNIII